VIRRRRASHGIASRHNTVPGRDKGLTWINRALSTESFARHQAGRRRPIRLCGLIEINVERAGAAFYEHAIEKRASKMKSDTQQHARARTGRRIAGHAQIERRTDPYQARQKLKEPTVCRQCGLVYQHGRWQSGQAPEAARNDVCPACCRIADGLPAGIVTLHGAAALKRKPEIVSLARHEEATEKAEHPLNRIIDIEESDDNLVISTTDIHLPRRIGTALKRALHGTLDTHFDDTAYFVRIDWRPPA
jgi:hypothetical protein